MIPMFGLNNVAISTLKQIPNRGMTYTGLNEPKTSLQWTKTNKLENPNCMRMSVLQTNTGGARGVLPCKATPFFNKVLRKPPLPSAGSIYPKQGYARGQPKGLAYMKDNPMNQPILKTHDFYNSAMNSKLK
jgi:hypothetical protein